jgi:hypothetical protein
MICTKVLVLALFTMFVMYQFIGFSMITSLLSFQSEGFRSVNATLQAKLVSDIAEPETA